MRDVYCDECGDVAVELEDGTLGEDVDGIHAACQSCGIQGKLVFIDDADAEGEYTYFMFRRLTEMEQSELAALAGEPDEVEREVDRMFSTDDSREIAQAMIRDGLVEQWLSQRSAASVQGKWQSQREQSMAVNLGELVVAGVANYMADLDDAGRAEVLSHVDRCIEQARNDNRGPGMAKCSGEALARMTDAYLGESMSLEDDGRPEHDD